MTALATSSKSRAGYSATAAGCFAGNEWRRGPYGDRDGDGIANRYDRDRDGDGIPNRYDNRGRNGPNGDRDRDGVANRHDRFPDNPRRS